MSCHLSLGLFRLIPSQPTTERVVIALRKLLNSLFDLLKCTHDSIVAAPPGNCTFVIASASLAGVCSSVCLRSSINLPTLSFVTFPKYLSPTWTTVPAPHQSRHSTSLSVNSPSFVVS